MTATGGAAPTGSGSGPRLVASSLGLGTSFGRFLASAKLELQVYEAKEGFKVDVVSQVVSALNVLIRRRSAFTVANSVTFEAAREFIEKFYTAEFAAGARE